MKSGRDVLKGHVCACVGGGWGGVQLNMMSLLLDSGADPNQETAAGLTPLMQAALSGRREAMRLLVSIEQEIRNPPMRTGIHQ
jgi:hypothetical protein